MANSIFLDTNGWLSLLNSAEALHEQADRAWRDIIKGKHPIVLTDWVVAETGNGLARFVRKDQLAEAFERIVRNSRTELIVVDKDLLRNALKFFSHHHDKTRGSSTARALS